jgi:hypothetical protein
MTINGMPAHPLLVHAVVVLLPLAALAVALHAVWPAAARRLGVVTPLLALGALAFVPLTVAAGHDLADSLGGTNPLLERHEELAEQVLPWAIALAVVAVAQWLIGRRASSLRLRIPAGVVSIAVAVVAVVVLVRAGDAGSQAVWSGFSG